MYSMWNAPSDRDYYDPNGVWEQEEEERCVDCGAREHQACMESCATQRLASSDDLDEQDDSGYGYPSEDELISWNEANDYIHEGEDACDDELHCTGLELAEEWA